MKINVGKILKPQGIRGEVKASCFLNDASMLKNVGTMFVKSTPHKVTSVRCDGAFFYVRFADIADRNAAETLRDLDVFCEKDDLIVGSDCYFVDDVMGCAVVLSNGKEVGIVTDVLQYGAADVFVCKNGEKEFSFPFLKDLHAKTDIPHKSISVDAERFYQVVTDDESESITDD